MYVARWMRLCLPARYDHCGVLGYWLLWCRSGPVLRRRLHNRWRVHHNRTGMQRHRLQLGAFMLGRTKFGVLA